MSIHESWTIGTGWDEYEPSRMGWTCPNCGTGNAPFNPVCCGCVPLTIPTAGTTQNG